MMLVQPIAYIQRIQQLSNLVLLDSLLRLVSIFTSNEKLKAKTNHIKELLSACHSFFCRTQPIFRSCCEKPNIQDEPLYESSQEQRNP